MSFPLQLGSHRFDDAPALARAVLDDARGGGGTVVDGQAPWQWVMSATEAGALERSVAVGLAAALLRASTPAGIAEGARLAAALGSDELGRLLPHALGAHDVGILLSRDPLVPDRSVEDTLLRAWTTLADRDDPDTRAALLTHLRNAGLPGQELQVLAAHGSRDEIERWLPAILLEGVPDEAEAALAASLAREVGRDVAHAMRVLAEPERRRLWDRWVASRPELAARTDLHETLFAADPEPVSPEEA